MKAQIRINMEKAANEKMRIKNMLDCKGFITYMGKPHPNFGNAEPGPGSDPNPISRFETTGDFLIGIHNIDDAIKWMRHASYPKTEGGCGVEIQVIRTFDKNGVEGYYVMPWKLNDACHSQIDPNILIMLNKKGYDLNAIMHTHNSCLGEINMSDYDLASFSVIFAGDPRKNIIATNLVIPQMYIIGGVKVGYYHQGDPLIRYNSENYKIKKFR